MTTIHLVFDIVSPLIAFGVGLFHVRVFKQTIAIQEATINAQERTIGLLKKRIEIIDRSDNTATPSPCSCGICKAGTTL